MRVRSAACESLPACYDKIYPELAARAFELVAGLAGDRAKFARYLRGSAGLLRQGRPGVRCADPRAGGRDRQSESL